MMLRFVYCDSGIFQVAFSLLPSPPPIRLRSSTNFEVSLGSNRKEPDLLFPSEEIRRAATFRFVLPPQAPLMLLPWIPAQRVLASRIDRFIVETTFFALWRYHFGIGSATFWISDRGKLASRERFCSDCITFLPLFLFRWWIST